MSRTDSTGPPVGRTTKDWWMAFSTCPSLVTFPDIPRCSFSKVGNDNGAFPLFRIISHFDSIWRNYLWCLQIYGNPCNKIQENDDTKMAFLYFKKIQRTIPYGAYFPIKKGLNRFSSPGPLAYNHELKPFFIAVIITNANIYISRSLQIDLQNYVSRLLWLWQIHKFDQ